MMEMRSEDRARARRMAATVLAVVVLLALATVVVPGWRRSAIDAALGRATVEERLAQLEAVVPGMLPRFERTEVEYPPKCLLFAAFKDRRRFELYAGPSPDELGFVRAYPIIGASGGPGPKLVRGDQQVPEGCYRVAGLNPNSRYHLSIELDYPNADDQRHAEADGRDPGDEIFIHGGAASVGCLAMGDAAIEELFYFTGLVGIEHVEVVIAPSDPRAGALIPSEGSPSWLADRYARITERIMPLVVR